MARLVPDGVGEVAWNGKAQYEVEPGGPVTVDLWERIVPFGAAAPLPDFQLVWSGDDYHVETRTSLPLGSLYQVRLYGQGQGRPTGAGNVLSALDFPSLVESNDRSQVIDRCLQAPQLEFHVGGTFASASVAVCPPSMARIQLGRSSPLTHSTGLGFFAPLDTVASAVSLSPNNMHRLDIMSRPSDADPLLPGNGYWFVVLAWTSQGLWDFVWNTAGAGGPPGTVTLKRRRVQVKLADLFIIDDSDDLSKGDATFKLEVRRGSTATNTQSFATSVNSGKQLIGIPAHMKVDTGPEKISSLLNGAVAVNVAAREDDSGSVPPDSDDHSHANFGNLDLPSGPAEQVSNQILSVNSVRDSGNQFRFIAQVVYSVSYE